MFVTSNFSDVVILWNYINYDFVGHKLCVLPWVAAAFTHSSDPAIQINTKFEEQKSRHLFFLCCVTQKFLQFIKFTQWNGSTGPLWMVTYVFLWGESLDVCMLCSHCSAYRTQAMRLWSLSSWCSVTSGNLARCFFIIIIIMPLLG